MNQAVNIQIWKRNKLIINCVQNNMMHSRLKNRLKFIFLLSTVFVLLLTSCGGPRKCNGGRGTQTDMGVM